MRQETKGNAFLVLLLRMFHGEEAEDYTVLVCPVISLPLIITGQNGFLKIETKFFKKAYPSNFELNSFKCLQ